MLPLIIIASIEKTLKNVTVYESNIDECKQKTKHTVSDIILAADEEEV